MLSALEAARALACLAQIWLFVLEITRHMPELKLEHDICNVF